MIAIFHLVLFAHASDACIFFLLGKGEILVATSGDSTLGTIPLGEETYEWVEHLLVKWMIASIKLKL